MSQIRVVGSRRVWPLLASVGLVLSMVGVLGVPAAEAAGPGYNVFVGYADNLRSGSNQSPTPWAGSTGVTFAGCLPVSSCAYDAGAIRVANATAVSETVDFVKVNFDGCLFDIWPHNVAIGAGGQLILTQTVSGAGNGCTVGTTTGPSTLDSSDFGPHGAGWAGNCSPSGYTPQVTVSVNGSAATYPDTGLVLNTNGVDAASCARPGFPAGNETTQWVSIGSPACPTGAVLTLAPASQTAPVGSKATVTAHLAACGTPLQGATVNFSVLSGPNSGAAGTGPAVTDPAGNATFTYTSSVTGTDTLQATVTNLAGTIPSYTVTVNWVPATPTISTSPSGPVPAGGSVSDTATVAGGAAPTGTVTFSLFGPGDTGCGTVIASRSVAVAGNGTYASGPVTATTAGTYNWVASYSGDANNNPAVSSCGTETVTVTPQVMTGRAYGVSGRVLSLTVAPTPDTGPVATTSSGTTSTPCTATTGGLLTAHVLCANVTTSVNPGPATSTSKATVADANLALPLLPAVQLQAVEADSTTSCSGSTGLARIASLKIGGTTIVANATPAPNSTVNVAGIKVIMNEQVPVPGGLTVNAVHIIVPGLADVIIASATSDIHNCPQR